MRKVIQISSVAAPCEPTAHDAFCEVFALCDDGAVFNGFWKVGVFEWKQLPPIPQPEIAADDVVMPNVGDLLIVTNHPEERQFIAKFEGVCSGTSSFGAVLARDNSGRGGFEYWKFNLNDPWRDATGKIVDV